MRPAAVEEVPRLARMLAAAFQNDPVYQWLSPTGGARRQQALERLFGIFLRDVMARGQVFTTAEGLGAALWLPPNPPRPSPLAAVRQNWQVARLVGRYLYRGFLWWYFIERHHPPYPYWYLFLIGVAPEHQGKGIGGRLLQPVLAMCDRERLPVYLDAGNERNVPFYAKRRFATIREVALPGGPKVYQMVRPPQALESLPEA